MGGLEQPAAAAFESSSGPIIEMLEKLNEKFIDERTSLQKEEMSAKQAYDMLMMDLQAQIGNAQKSKDEKSEAKAAALQGKADAEADVEDTTSVKDADTKFLQDLTASCQ